MPRSMVAWIVFLAVFLIISTCMALRERVKSRRHRYLKVSSYPTHHSLTEQSTTLPPTYQNASDYALPPRQKVVTYCVIDGRLVDK